MVKSKAPNHLGEKLMKYSLRKSVDQNGPKQKLKARIFKRQERGFTHPLTTAHQTYPVEFGLREQEA